MGKKKQDKKAAKGIMSPPPLLSVAQQQASPQSLLGDKQQQKFNNLQGIIDSGGQLGKKQAKKYNKLTGIQAGKTGSVNDQFKGLTGTQNQIINQQQGSDLALGSFANSMTPKIWEQYSQAFDWGKGPQSPVGDDFQAWKEQQTQQGNQAFDNRFNPVFAQQSEEFEQQMANRGIPMGSQLYNQEKSRIEQGQNDARTQGYYQASQNAGQNAEQFFNIGNQARGNYLSEAFSQRNLPLNEFGMLQGAQSGMDMQNLGYSQQLGVQGQLISGNQALQNSAWHPSEPAPYGGFGSQQDQWAAEDGRTQANQQWLWDNQPKQSGGGGPSTWATIGGSVAGNAAGAFAGSYGNSLFA